MFLKFKDTPFGAPPLGEPCGSLGNRDRAELRSKGLQGLFCGILSQESAYTADRWGDLEDQLAHRRRLHLYRCESRIPSPSSVSGWDVDGRSCGSRSACLCHKNNNGRFERMALLRMVCGSLV